MTAKQKTRSDAATSERARVETAAGQAAISDSDFITAAAGRQAGFVEALLPQGEAHAIPTRQLVALCGYRSARELQKQIERERMAGALILSKSGDGGGYYLPDSGEAGRREIAAFVQTVNARAVNSLRTLKAARRALGETLREAEGKTALDLAGDGETGDR